VGGNQIILPFAGPPEDSLFCLGEAYYHFYPRDAMLARVFAIVTCLSVRLSVRQEPVLCQNEKS